MMLACSLCYAQYSSLHTVSMCSTSIKTTEWAKWWHSLTGFNMRDYPHIHESILFGFPGHSDDAIAINYCILYAKHFIYRANSNNQNMLTIDFLSYLSHLKYILKIEKNTCIAKNQIVKFEKFNNIYDNL